MDGRCGSARSRRALDLGPAWVPGGEDRDRPDGRELDQSERRLKDLAEAGFAVVQVVERAAPVERAQHSTPEPGVVARGPEDRSAEQHAGRGEDGGDIGDGDRLSGQRPRQAVDHEGERRRLERPLDRERLKDIGLDRGDVEPSKSSASIESSWASTTIPSQTPTVLALPVLRQASQLVELLEPNAADSPISRFIDRRGPGIHHICFAVHDLADTLARCRAHGIKLIDEVPRVGAEGKRIAFLHPASTGGVLIELTED